jgi:O-antigen ligase
MRIAVLRASQNEDAGTQARDRRRTYLVPALLAMVYAVPLTLPWTVAGAHIALGCAGLLALLHRALLGRWPVARTPADRAFLAFASASGLAALAALPPVSEAEPLKKLLLIPFVHVVAGTLDSLPRVRRGLRLFLLALVGTAGVASTLFLVHAHGDDARLRSTTHYMTFSGLLLLGLPLAAAPAALGPRRLRPAYALAALVLGFALLLTQTRGAWLGACAAGCAVLARLRARLLLLVPPAVVVLFLLLPSPYRSRVLSSFDLSYHSNANRLTMWRTGLAMWRARPLTGVGLGDLQPLYLQYAPPGVTRTFGHLHNNWVNVLAAMGGLGIASFAWLMLAFGRIVRRAAAAPDPELRALALGAWGSFWGFQIMGLFEWNFGDVEVMLALYFLTGVLAAFRSAGGRDPAATPAPSTS